MYQKKRDLRLGFNSPVILGFMMMCLVALLLDFITRGLTNHLFFSVYQAPLTDPLTYMRLIGHIFGHADWEHFIGNSMLILIIGPLLEEKYGHEKIAFIMLITALVTGIFHMIFFPGVQLLGASGVVFAFIVLSSFTRIEEGVIPLTFVLVVIIYMGEQVYQGLFSRDNISQITHIVGGLIGTLFGLKIKQ